MASEEKEIDSIMQDYHMRMQEAKPTRGGDWV